MFIPAAEREDQETNSDRTRQSYFDWYWTMGMFAAAAAPHPQVDPIEEAKQLFNPAIERALQALSNPNSDCNKLFGTPETWKQGWDPRLILTAIKDGSVLANSGERINIEYRNFGEKGPKAEVRKSPWGNLTLIINTFSDGIRNWWRQGNSGANAHTLLHELGHIYDYLGKSCGLAIVNDTSFWGTSLKNEADDNAKMVNDACF